jgi:hypothetical protein
MATSNHSIHVTRAMKDGSLILTLAN